MIRFIKEMPNPLAGLVRLVTDTGCTAFRLSPYLIEKKTEGGLLVFATLTCALLYADGVSEAWELCEAARSDPELRKTLLACRVLISENSDERKLCEQLRVLMLGTRKRSLRGRMTHFIIFTTTACNARCYYCFEHGYETCTMSEETAVKTAEYIEAHAEGEVTLTWFGGEPLVNAGAIDIVTEYLTAHNVPFKSHIVSNSYLFTPELIEKAVSKWRLEQAQITLDGTRENYNRIKNYAGGVPDAYSRVMANMDALSENGVRILINLLLSEENESDMYALLRELLPKITAKQARYSVTVNILQQYGGTPKEDEMQRKLIRMKRWMRENGYEKNPLLPDRLLINSCSADNPGMACIQADGGLNRCDHISECPPYGSIFSDEIDAERMNWWTERREPLPECEDCALYPQCLRLAHCAAKRLSCTDITRNDRISEIRDAMERERL